jgi:glycosyltransferase XagB
LKLEEDQLIIAISEPDPAVILLVEGLTGLAVQAYLLAPEEIQKQLKNLYGQTPSHSPPVISEVDELLQKTGILSTNQLREIKSAAAGANKSFEEEIITADYINEISLVEALSLRTGIPYIHLDHAHFHESIVAQIPASVASGHTMVPIWSNNTEMWLVVADPFDAQGLMKAEQSTGKRIWTILAPRSTISAALERLLGERGINALDPRVLNLVQKLVETGLLTQSAGTQALQEFSQEKLPLDRAITNASHRSPVEVTHAIGQIIGLSFVDLQLEEQIVTRVDPLGQIFEKVIINDPIDEQAARLLSLQDAQHLSAIPISTHADQVVVAFADPNFEQDLEELKSKISQKIVPVIAIRDDLESAIQRVLGKRNIGNHLLLDGLITRSQLNNALDLARNTGVRLGKALVNRGYITENQLYRYLAKQTSLPFYDLAAVEIDKELAHSIPAKTARELGILPIRDDSGKIMMGIVDPYNSEALAVSKELLGEDLNLVLITENDLDRSLENLYNQEYLAQSISELLERSPEDSAYRVLNTAQIIIIILILLISVIWTLFDFMSYFIFINTLSTIFYITFSSYKFYLVYRAFAHVMEVTVTPEDLQALSDRDLPVYTILVPAYKEAEVLPELLGALKKLDYPTTKLDIQVLMEQDDQATINAFNKWNPPSHFHGIVVPYGEPKTKPKACNYGLIHARGDYIVIFDAEDIPQPDQLKKIIVAFSKSKPQIACIQSKLNYYNSDQNLLTRWFTVEYSMWFDLFLPGLSASSAPIPLGGTSNHFKKDVLVEIGAWDPYNVTEDADLGVRLFKRGYQTAIVESTTFEEANSKLGNWIRQRSRWIKGYIQTWLVHMRHPVRLIREIGIKGFFSFQFVVGGTFFAALINPIYWMLTTLWFLLNWKFVQVIFPDIIFFMGALCLFIGNFAFTYMNVAGALRRGQYSMVKVALISPIYWALASVAAWLGFIQLLYKPHFWEKTTHGLYTETKKEDSAQGQ